MNKGLKKLVMLYIISALTIFLIFTFFPINFFEGEIVYNSGIARFVEKRPLSLRFVMGLEGDPLQITGVKDYHLVWKGYLLAGILILGIPGLITYRFFLKTK